MIPAAFDYVRPTSVSEALAALGRAGDDGKVLAGGQSLMPVLRVRLAAPSVLIDLGGVAGLRGIRLDGDVADDVAGGAAVGGDGGAAGGGDGGSAGGALVIGAMTTHAEIVGSELVRAEAPLLAAVAATVADPQVRHRGTLGGALSHADPGGDLGTAAVAMDATMVIEGPAGRRSVAARDFFVDLFTTALGPDELLVEVRFPRMPGWRVHYEKFKRTHQAWALVGVAAAVRRSNGSIAEARVAFTNMGPTPVRATGVESALVGAADLATVKAAAASANEGTSPPSDTAGSAEYRRHLAEVLTARALAVAAGL